MLAGLAAAPLAVRAQACPDAVMITRDLAVPLAAVRFLANDALAGRLAGSDGEHCAGDYIASVFRRLGLVPAGEAGTYFQSVPLASVLTPHAPPGTGRNVVGLIQGADPELRRQVVVIGAHYDHLGLGGFGSLASNQTGQIHNGADDNASGVAAMLRVAELTADTRPPRSVLFIAFTGEEFGLLGSAHFAANPTVPFERVVAMINMDMVGRLGSGPLIVYGVDTAAEWRGIVESAAARAGVAIAVRGEGYGPSDHTSFYARDIPVLHFFTNVHADYHRPTDDWERIDAAGIDRVATIVAVVTTAVAERRPALTLVTGAGEPPRPAAAGRGYGAYLGSVPDFAPVERGVRLSGVSPGSPAQKAGLRTGDIIIGLGTHDVADLQGLTDALGAHQPGDMVDVRLLRDGTPLTVRVQLGSRASRTP